MTFTVDLSPYEIELRDTKDLVTKLNAMLSAVQSAVNAAGLGVLNILGFHDASTGSYPSTPSANDAWVIDTAGTISTVPYIKGDVIAYTGSAWVKVLGTADIDTASVAAAGALMDSELADLTAVKTLSAPDNTTISAFGASLVDDASAAAARGTLGLDTDDDVEFANITGVALFQGTEIDADAGSSKTLDFAANANFDITLTEDCTFPNPSTEQVGQKGLMTFRQDGTGGWDGSFGTQYKNPPTLGGAAGEIVKCAYDVVAAGQIEISGVTRYTPS